jgi:type IV pilus assembly protein PilE
MNIKMLKKIPGFTLVELMIVILIVAVLIALAYPSYVDYVRKARRGEAQQLLLNWAINQEIWRSNNTTYAAADCNTGICAPINDRYVFSLAAGPTAVAYTLQAVAQGDQLNDKSKAGDICSPLTLNQSGTKLPAACWD